MAHGAFNLEHTWLDYPSLQQGSTKNLMDYGGGNVLRKYQWDLIHHPRLIIPWLQDDEGAKIVFGENVIGNVLRAVSNIRCSHENGDTKANLYFSTSSKVIQISDLITAFDWAGSDVSEEKIEIYISNDQEINLDYFEDEFDITNIEFDDVGKKVILKGKERWVYFQPYDKFSDNKDQVYNFIKSIFDFGIPIKKAAATEVNAMEIDELRYLSECDLELLTTGNRKNALKEISESTIIDVKGEKLALNLLKSVQDKSELYNFLQDDEIAYNLFNGIDTYRKEFISLVNWLCLDNWTETERQGADKIFLGSDDNSLQYQFAEGTFFDGEENKIFIRNIQDYGGPSNYHRDFNFSPLAPVKLVYFDGTVNTVPAVLAKYLSDNENNKEWVDAFFQYLNGVGLSSAGRILTSKVASSLAKFIVIVEFGKTSVDIIFEDEQLKQRLKDNGHEWFVNNWSTVSLALDIATMGTELITSFAKKGDDLSRILRQEGKTEAADHIDEITQEAKRIVPQVEIPSGLTTKFGDQVNKLDNWLTKYADELPENASDILEDLNTKIGSKQILEIKEDGAGRFLVQTLGGNRNQVFAVMKRQDGTYVTYNFNAYKPSANLGYDVPLSDNLLAPDYKGTKYMYPKEALNPDQKNIVRIKMTGQYKTKSGDFYSANEAAGFVDEFGSNPPTRIVDGDEIDYTWHHVDDMIDENSDIWCTMQLVESVSHTKLKGFGHSGAAAQYRVYTDNVNAYK